MATQHSGATMVDSGPGPAPKDRNGIPIRVLDSISHTDQRVGWRTVQEIISSNRVRFASHGYGTEEGHDLATYWTIVARDGRPFDSAAEAEKGKAGEYWDGRNVWNTDQPVAYSWDKDYTHGRPRHDMTATAQSAAHAIEAVAKWSKAPTFRYADGQEVKVGDWYRCHRCRRQVLAIEQRTANYRLESGEVRVGDTFSMCSLLRRGVVGERYEGNDLKIGADGNPVMIGSNLAEKIAERLEPHIKPPDGVTMKRNGAVFTFTAVTKPIELPQAPPVYRFFVNGEEVKKAEPAPLTYAEFRAIVERVAREEAPRCKVVTDTTPGKFVAWFDLLGLKQHVQLLDCKDARAAESLALLTVRGLVMRLGEREAGR